MHIKLMAITKKRNRPHIFSGFGCLLTVVFYAAKYQDLLIKVLIYISSLYM